MRLCCLITKQAASAGIGINANNPHTRCFPQPPKSERSNMGADIKNHRRSQTHEPFRREPVVAIRQHFPEDLLVPSPKVNTMTAIQDLVRTFRIRSNPRDKPKGRHRIPG